MFRVSTSALIIIAALSVSACNTSVGPDSPASYVSAPAGVTPRDFKLPTGAGCGADIARFHSVIDNDLRSGHTTEEVHGKALGRIAEADRLCNAGNANEATGLLIATKRQLGYPVN